MDGKRTFDAVAIRSQGTNETVTDAEKRLALNHVLSSKAFARHSQLKRFLEYVCELELEGRASEIHEYLIGVSVLGRLPGYSTGEDSSVRRQAHSLRQKLHEFYLEEMPTALLRIELPKGGYVPRFVRYDGVLLPDPSGQPAMETSPAELPWRDRRRLLYAVALSFLGGILITSGFFSVLRIHNHAMEPSLNPLIREAWGPVLAPQGSTLVYLDTAVQLLVRQLPDDALEARSQVAYPVPRDPEIHRWILDRYRPQPGTELYMILTNNSPLWGETAGALTAVGILSAARVSYQILPERVSSLFALRERNAVVLARPEFSPAAGLLLAETAFTIRYSNEAHAYVILRQDRSRTRPEVYADQPDIARFGLISVLRSPGAADSGKRIILFSGLHSAGLQAGAEFFSSPDKLQAFRELLKKQGYPSWPKSYQIVVKAPTEVNLPLTVEYVSHCVLER